MWYSARAELGIDRARFLAISPRELDGLLEAINARERRQFIPAALICSVMANLKRDPEQRDEPWTIHDFLPGADGPQSKEEEMIEWLQALERGEEPELDPEALAKFKRKMQATFKNMQGGSVTTVGPSGKEETI